MCTDYRKVNAVTKADNFPIPRIDDCIDAVGQSNVVSKFDLLKGFWQDYLQKFGYLDSLNPGALRTEESYIKGLRMFQKFAGLKITGRLDAETKATMLLPRCGVADQAGNALRVRRRRRFATQGSKWPKTSLTYKIRQYTQKLARNQVEDAIKKAFKVWSDVTQLEFRKASGTVDIDLDFARASHGDGYPFDGSGSTLAHAFFPQYGGDAHFDEDERWTLGTKQGINLVQVAAHEFGHSLGLDHSEVSSAVMTPFYRGYLENFKLDTDDILAIQSLYDIKRLSLCEYSKIDAITRIKDGRTFVFAGKNYYPVNNAGNEAGNPRRISTDWGGVEGPIDAALTVTHGNTYLFKGLQYWKFENLQKLDGYPRHIADGFPGIPSNLDAAFTWSGNGLAYFVKGTQYYRYSLNATIAARYPQPLQNWRGLPSTIDAAFEWQNGRTYFFHGQNYYRFNDILSKHERDNPYEHNGSAGAAYLSPVDSGYPLSTTKEWFGCPSRR
ncbi:matrix metalloproteinase-14-like [Liolophura sinensis]|uniref:matrix metalloproteinase-14-like n=1 Tax=Liolophura sinensis TaxID=3198878 RepID=UPI0031591C97